MGFVAGLIATGVGSRELQPVALAARDALVINLIDYPSVNQIGLSEEGVMAIDGTQIARHARSAIFHRKLNSPLAEPELAVDGGDDGRYGIYGHGIAA